MRIPVFLHLLLAGLERRALDSRDPGRAATKKLLEDEFGEDAVAVASARFPRLFDHDPEPAVALKKALVEDRVPMERVRRVCLTRAPRIVREGTDRAYGQLKAQVPDNLDGVLRGLERGSFLSHHDDEALRDIPALVAELRRHLGDVTAADVVRLLSYNSFVANIDKVMSNLPNLAALLRHHVGELPPDSLVRILCTNSFVSRLDAMMLELPDLAATLRREIDGITPDDLTRILCTDSFVANVDTMMLRLPDLVALLRRHVGELKTDDLVRILCTNSFVSRLDAMMLKLPDLAATLRRHVGDIAPVEFARILTTDSFVANVDTMMLRLPELAATLRRDLDGITPADLARILRTGSFVAHVDTIMDELPGFAATLRHHFGEVTPSHITRLLSRGSIACRLQDIAATAPVCIKAMKGIAPTMTLNDFILFFSRNIDANAKLFQKNSPATGVRSKVSSTLPEKLEGPIQAFASEVQAAAIKKAARKDTGQRAPDRQSHWTADERARFLAAYEAQSNKKRKDWKVIAYAVQTKTPKQCVAQGLQFEDKRKRVAPDCSRWTSGEHARFLAAYDAQADSKRKSWKAIAAAVQTRTARQCMVHARNFEVHGKRATVTTHWAADEHARFLAAYEAQSNRKRKSWKAIASAVKTRTITQCIFHARKFEKEEKQGPA